MRYIWLLRKHPRHPHPYCGGYLEAFTISGVFYNHAAAANVAKEKNKRSNNYLYTVKRMEIGEALK